MDQQARELLADLLLKWEDQFLQGVDVPAEQLAIDSPELIEPLTKRIEVLRTSAWMDERDDEPVATVEREPSPQGGRVLCARYRLDELVACGGFAEVWRAVDLQLERTVAIKLPQGPRVVAREAFLAEARNIAHLQHPAIVAIHDVGTDDGDIFLVTPFFHGGTLAERLAEKTLSREEAIRWFAQLCDGLEYAHRHNIIHCDIKPANILIDDHGDAVLVDFGIARQAAGRAAVVAPAGTLRYMAPEQLLGSAVGPSADIYSLGIVLHEAITGKTPHLGSTPAEVRKEVTSESGLKVSPAMPEDLARICSRAIQREPADRYQTAAEFEAAIRRCRRHGHSRRLAMAAGVTAGFFGLLTFFLPQKENAVEFVSDRPQRKRSQKKPKPVECSGQPVPVLAESDSTGFISKWFRRAEETLPYVIKVENVSLYEEWQEPPDTYLGAAVNDLECSVVFQFAYARPTASVRLIAEAMCWDFSVQDSGVGRGAAAIDVSADAHSWEIIRDTVSTQVWGGSWVYDDWLPPSVLGGRSLFVRIRLLSTGATNTDYSVAQFCRNRLPHMSPTFGVVTKLAGEDGLPHPVTARSRP
jgi:serine/threonine protein kinase